MRVVIVGGTGNIGRALVRALEDETNVSEIVVASRRPPGQQLSRATHVPVDLAVDDLVPVFQGADAVVHLGWIFQPTRNPMMTWRVNAEGSARVFAAAATAEASALLYSSSVGAYSPRVGSIEFVDESWPTHSNPAAGYGREKAYVERALDAVEARQPSMRVVRFRPAFVFQETAATQQRRLFAGPFLPGRLIQPGRLPFAPYPAGLRFQALHADDVADAFRRALLGDVRGPFNLAADPVIDAEMISELLDTRVRVVPAKLVRAAAAVAWRMHLVPAEPALFDLVMSLPLMDASRARTELGWQPRYSAMDALRAFVRGLGSGAGDATAPLAADSLRGRTHEVRTGVGARP